MIRFLVALAFLGLNSYVYYYLASDAVLPERREFGSFPMQLGEWTCPERQSMSASVEKNLGVTDYLICDYTRRDPFAIANVYVGYHATQVREEGGGAGENSIHPPAHCLPGSGWDVISSKVVMLDTPGLPEAPAHVRRLVIAKGEQRSLVYYWYQSRGRVISEDWKKILFMGFDRATRHRTDGSLVRFTIPIDRGNEKKADDVFLNLAPRVVQLLPDYVPG